MPSETVLETAQQEEAHVEEKEAQRNDTLEDDGIEEELTDQFTDQMTIETARAIRAMHNGLVAEAEANGAFHPFAIVGSYLLEADRTLSGLLSKESEETQKEILAIIEEMETKLDALYDTNDLASLTFILSLVRSVNYRIAEEYYFSLQRREAEEDTDENEPEHL